MPLELQEIDFRSRTGSDMLARLTLADGGALVPLADKFSRAFTVSTTWAPGLCFVGGIVSATAPVGSSVKSIEISVGGCGASLEEALKACLGEAAERSAIFEPAGVQKIAGRYADVRDRVMPSARAIVEDLLAEQRVEDRAHDWCEVREIVGDRGVLVPCDWMFRRARAGALLPAGIALSTGVAAGPTPDWATERAVRELIERDAVALWWVGGRCPRAVDRDAPCCGTADLLLERLRAGSSCRQTWFLDVTSDLGVPCAIAASCDSKGRGLAMGMAARSTLEAALAAATIEFLQMEVGLQVAEMKFNHAPQTVTETDRKHLLRSKTIDVGACELLRPAGSPQARHLIDGTAPISKAVQAMGSELAVSSLGPTKPGLIVVRALAPDLQPLSGHRMTDRLQLAIQETGGGQRWTLGVPLM